VHDACARIAEIRLKLADARQVLQKCVAPVVVIREGDTSKFNPFTIAIIANPLLENPTGSGNFIEDPIMGDRAAFDACVAYIVECLFGNLPGQLENFLANSLIEPKIRIVALFLRRWESIATNSLVGQMAASNILEPRAEAYLPFLKLQFGIDADVAYAVSKSATHNRASAFGMTDDDDRPGTNFILDGVTLSHRFFTSLPGTIAIHADKRGLTALHEFGHAVSSYTNGFITDLYVDSGPALNVKVGRPIPTNFANYNGTIMAADQTRDGLGYPAGWQSYHCGLLSALPAVMDSYRPGSQHDRITRQFLTERLLAKISR